MLASDEVMRPYFRERAHWQYPLELLLSDVLRPGARLLCLGAEVGYLVLRAVNVAKDIRVVAVEASPVLFPLLQANLWANGVEAELWNVATGDRRRMIPVCWESSSPTEYHFEEAVAGRQYGAVVPMVPTDDLLGGRSIDVAIVRARGWESDIVLGMQRTVKSSPGMVVIVDFWPSAIRRRGLDPQGVVDRYRAMGFDSAVHDDWGLGNCELGEVVRHCDSAGPTGRVRLVLRRSAP